MRYNIIAVWLLLSFSASAQEGIKADEFLNHVQFLAADKLKGRFPGSAGNKKAANYIKKHFEKSRIRPIGPSYFQEFEIVQRLDPGPKNKLPGMEGLRWKLNSNFSVFSYSANKEASAPLVFVGDSLSLLENRSLIKNHWVLLLRQNRSVSLNDYALAKKAADLGASGVIYYNAATDTSDELVRLRPGRFQRLNIPVIHVSQDALKKIMQAYFSQARVPDKAGLISEQPFSARIQVLEKKVKTNNVIGIIESEDDQFKNEFIVIGAHYDHLGMGGPGTGTRKPGVRAIHNGADDNASGTSALLEISEELKKHQKGLKRSVIVVAFGAEEGGLLGSAYFVNKPPVPKEAIRLMINMDMVGRLNSENQLYMGGAGTFPGGE